MLALLPGLVALAGDFDWDKLTIFPGLVASGGALLFGVNSWCLDGRGALWRDSLPVSPAAGVRAPGSPCWWRSCSSPTAVTLLLARLRAGLPNVSELVAMVCAAVVRHRAGGRDVAALVGAQPVRRGPAQLARHAGAAAGDGRLLRRGSR